MAAADKAALDAMVEETVQSNLKDFASSFTDPGANLWVDLRQAVHDKSKRHQQKKS